MKYKVLSKKFENYFKLNQTALNYFNDSEVLFTTFKAKKEKKIPKIIPIKAPKSTSPGKCIPK